MKDRGNPITEVWNKIPDDTDILITHGPPMYVLDKTVRGEHVGCYDLASKVSRLDLKLHVFGHIHLMHGTEHINGTTFVNASTCDEQYQPVNKPIVIDLPDKE